MQTTPSRTDYVHTYFTNNYGDGKPSIEAEAVGKFLAKNVSGKALDCGCGPAPQIRAICMPSATEIHAVDLAPESIIFVHNELKNKDKYPALFHYYQEIAEKISGKLPEDYISKQIDKIQSIQEADMSQKLPFPNDCFDTVMSIYSLGVLQNETELDAAIHEMARVLTKGGKLIHINTNGQNKNDILPEYTCRGLSQVSEILFPYLQKTGFENISLEKFKLEENKSASMYKYDEISLLLATKK